MPLTTTSRLPEPHEVPRLLYASPELVEWGTVEELTLGEGGGKQDGNFTGTET